jgi:hypothetical protein
VSPEHPVVVVSPGVVALAGLRVAAVAPVPAMRWFSFVHEGLFQQWNQTGAPILNAWVRGCRDGYLRLQRTFFEPKKRPRNVQAG